MREPDILGIFQENILLKYPWPDILEMPRKIVVNTRKDADALAESYPWFSGHIYYLNGIAIAMQTKSRMNMIMLGAMMKALEDEEIISGQSLGSGQDQKSGMSQEGEPNRMVKDFLACGRQMIEETVGKKYPDLLEINLNGFMAGHAMVQHFHRRTEEKTISEPRQEKLVWGL